MTEIFDKYYLLKNGHNFGRDSVYLFDAQFPCESEGLINFIDIKTELQGCFNGNGQIQIPAIYNYIGPFNNGYAAALIGASKKEWNHKGESDCNHWSWKGGKKVLINKNNQILIHNFNENNLNLDYYSIIISDIAIENSLYESFRSTDDKFYNFLNFTKEFESYFFQQCIHETDKLDHYFTVVTHWEDTSREWIYHWDEERKKLVHRLFTERFLNSDDWNYSIINHVDLIMSLESELAFIKYMNNCFGHNNIKFPTFAIDFTHKNTKEKSHLISSELLMATN